MVAATIETRARQALAAIDDPEIPGLSIADLGIIERIEVTDDAVEADLLPTFAGCPAQFAIREDAEKALAAVAEGRAVRVRMIYDPPWTTDRITETGRARLAEIGVAPPTGHGPAGGDAVLQIGMRCPYCGTPSTTFDAAFGPTPCRSIRYCASCKNPFEGFKTKEA